MNSNCKKQVSVEMMKEMKKELEYLKNVKRKEIAEQLRHAISFGDLKENAAYHEAKEAQGFLEGKILELNHAIKESVIYSESTEKSVISIGSRVEISLNGEKEEYLIVGGRDSNPLEGKVSSDSPVGKALLGKSAGEKCQIETPSGEKIEITILEIK